MNVYNEIDPFASRWLEALVGAGEIADGRVESRSIEELRPEEVAAAPQFHTFAGIGVWSYALRLAGWPDDRPVWTGSCPCQPFSSAGKRGGFGDERHLWPAWFRLIRECRPPVIFGEQVASKDGLAWLDTVCADLEGEGYAVGAADLCAAGVGAPHIRQRLFFVAERVADADNARREGRVPRWEGSQRGGFDRHAGCGGSTIGVGDTRGPAGERDARSVPAAQEGKHGARVAVDGPEPVGSEHAGASVGGVADADQQHGDDWGYGAVDERREFNGSADLLGSESAIFRPGPTNGHWREADWLFCRDGKWRPVEPSSFPLAHGAPARVGRLRGYGNAIVPQVAATFIRAYMDGTFES